MEEHAEEAFYEINGVPRVLHKVSFRVLPNSLERNNKVNKARR